MLQQPMMEKLHALKLQGLIEALERQEQDETARELSFLDRLALLIDQQWNWRQNQALARRVRASRLKGAACVENIDYRAERGLSKSVIRALAQDSAWVKNHEHIFVLGPTGVGKSYVASALAQKACRDGYSVYYTRTAALFRDLNLARADGSLRQLLKRLNRIDVLVIDDWAMAPMSETERRDFWEIAEDRYQARSMILTSQLPVSRWHEQIGDPTLADSILDRLGHNAHRIEMCGESVRKKTGGEGETWKTIYGRKAVEEPGKRRPWKSQERVPLSHSFGDDDNLSLDDRDHFLENPTASVASLRRLITSIPEC